MTAAPSWRSRFVAGEVEHASKSAWLLKEPNRFEVLAGAETAADRLSGSHRLFLRPLPYAKVKADVREAVVQLATRMMPIVRLSIDRSATSRFVLAR
jgi:hypothetical protein